MLGKEGIGPAPMVRTAASAAAFASLAQDAAQAHADPFVNAAKRREMAVAKVAKPSPQRLVDVPDDLP